MQSFTLTSIRLMKPNLLLWKFLFSWKVWSEGVRAGGKLALQLRKLKVKALYNVIPERLVVDVTSLGLGKTIKVGELSYEGLELINAKEAVVCAVKLTRAARGAAATAGK